jgi:hypothetical protein
VTNPTKPHDNRDARRCESKSRQPKAKGAVRQCPTADQRPCCPANETAGAGGDPLAAARKTGKSGSSLSLTPETNEVTVPKTRSPSPPKGTQASGRRLWRAVLDQFELDEHELALLREAVRTVDHLDALADILAEQGLVIETKTGARAHPALVESRQLRIALARILAALRLPDGEAGDESQGRRPQRRVGARGLYAIGGTA